MKDFGLYLPVRIIFGRGRVKQLIDELHDSHVNILIISDKVISKQTQIVKDLQQNLSTRNIFLFDEIEENPSFETIDRGGLSAINNKIDLVIGVGGGSCMDAAKGIAIRAANNHSTRDIVLGGKQIDNSLPVYCLPTTSGTGSEVTPFAVFSDLMNDTKEGFGHDLIFPAVSIIDPELTYSMPSGLVLNTGLDVLAHSIEAYLSEECSDLTDTLAIRAIELVNENLARAVKKDKQAMDNMAYASMLAGVAITHASTILPHIMGYPLTVYHKVPHGRASAILIPSFLSYLSDKKLKKEKLLIIEKIFTDTGSIKGYFESLGVSVNLKDYGVEESELLLFVQKTIVKGDVKITPGNVSEKHILSIYQSMMR